MPLASLHARAEALQGAVHAGGAHAQTHGREAAQVHGEWPGLAHRPGDVGQSWLGAEVWLTAVPI